MGVSLRRWKAYRVERALAGRPDQSRMLRGHLLRYSQTQLWVHVYRREDGSLGAYGYTLPERWRMGCSWNTSHGNLWWGMVDRFALCKRPESRWIWDLRADRIRRVSQQTWEKVCSGYGGRL